MPGWKYRNSSVCPSTKSSSRNPVQVKGKVPTPKALPLRDEAGAALRYRLYVHRAGTGKRLLLNFGKVEAGFHLRTQFRGSAKTH